MTLWDFKASFYHFLRSFPPFGWILQDEMRKLRRLIQKVDGPLKIVLDMGTGAGSTLGMFPDAVRIVGVDRSFRMIRRARRMREIDAVVGEAHRLPVGSGTIPFVSTVGLTEYLQDMEGFVEEMGRVLRPGGYWLATVAPPNALNRLRNLLGHRVHVLRSEECERLFSGYGFFVVEEERSLLQRMYLLQKRRALSQRRRFK